MRTLGFAATPGMDQVIVASKDMKDTLQEQFGDAVHVRTIDEVAGQRFNVRFTSDDTPALTCRVAA